MNNNYSFSNDELENYKDKKTLIWYSDCYYNPDDEWSLASVSCLHIEKTENAIVVWPTKKLDEMREVVDERLQKTLEDRLQRSFNSVVEQLEREINKLENKLDKINSAYLEEEDNNE